MSAAALGNAKLTEPPARQPTILVVEDHDDTREMLHTILEMWGCRVVEAGNGLEAVEAASGERPQLILIDGRLPFLDGLEALAAFVKTGSGIKLRFWRSMARAVHAITLMRWRLGVMIALKNPLI